MAEAIDPQLEVRFFVPELAALEIRRYCSSCTFQWAWDENGTEILSQDDCLDTCRIAYIRDTRHRVGASLAGNKGDIRFHPTLSGNPKSDCTKAYNAYVAASGHSAYATTPYMRVTSIYIICGAHLNAQSQKAAEDLAMKSCKATRAHYKVTTGGACEIAASK